MWRRPCGGYSPTHPAITWIQPWMLSESVPWSPSRGGPWLRKPSATRFSPRQIWGFRLDSVPSPLPSRPGCRSTKPLSSGRRAPGSAKWRCSERASGVRSEIPPLPRRAQVRSSPPEGFRGRSRGGMASISAPRGFRADPTLADPRVHRDLELALGLPMAVPGEDLQKLPRPIWMRYTLQIVKATGGEYPEPGRAGGSTGFRPKG